MIQATEAIKLLTGIGEPLTGRMLHVDTRTMQFREFRLRRDPACPACGENPTITSPQDIDFFCELKIPNKQLDVINAADFEKLLKAPSAGYCVLDVREKWEHLLTPWPPATLAIPFSELAARMGEVPADAPDMIVVCTIGERSAEAVRLLKERGQVRVRHLQDGLRDLPSYGQ